MRCTDRLSVRRPRVRPRWRGSAACALGAALLAGCASSLKQQPALKIPEADFRRRVDVLCVAPLRAHIGLPDGKEKVAAFEELLVSELNGHGMVIVPPDKTMAVYRDTVRKAGGFYDPHTGRRDPTNNIAVRSQALSALHTELGCDALLTPTIALVSTAFANGTAEWDGVKYRVGGGLGTSGWTAALSLWVWIHDLDHTEIYFGTGGIQPVFELNQQLLGEDFTPVADEQLLGDRVRNVQAISASLWPVLALRYGSPNLPPQPTASPAP